MKKLPILLFAIMMAGSLSAQIEEVSAEQYKKNHKREKTAIDYFAKVQYPSNLSGCDLRGQQLYCTQDQINGKPIIAVTISPDGSIGIKRIKKGAYYDVTNIICSRQELDGLREKDLLDFRDRILNSKDYVGDTIHYLEKGKEKIYTLSKSKKVDIPKLLDSEAIRISDTRIDYLYELTDKNGYKHYIGYENTIQLNNGLLVAFSGRIEDFISVSTFNYLKTKYENVELVRCEYYDPGCQRHKSENEDSKKRNIVKVEKIGINKKYAEDLQEIVFVYDDPSYGEKRIEPYIKETNIIPLRHTDTLNAVTLGINDGYKWVLRVDADSILNKWYEEEQAKEAIARAEKAKQKAEYVKKYGEKYAQNIIDGKVCVGMTKEMCRKAMGLPNNTSRSSSALGIVEVWTYSTMYELFGGLAPIIVVTFLDDKITSVDEYKENLPF